MTTNHFNSKKSLYRVVLGNAIDNSKHYPDQDHTGEHLLRSNITDPVLELANQIHTHIYLYIYFSKHITMRHRREATILRN